METEKFLSPTDFIAHDYKGLAKDEEATKINKAIVKMANDFDLDVD